MAARDQPPAPDSAQVPELAWKFQKAKKPQRLKRDGTPYKARRGWGPYRSVPNERAVAFNLQLDVQNLQQEIRNLSALRDILQTKTLLQRHSPEGSLCQVVNKYYQVFRKGVVDDRFNAQRAFMHSVMDEHVDLSHGFRGPDVMMEQMARYSTFLRFICMAGKVGSITVADDSVMVRYQGTLQFQILRSTIALVFPHILGDEWLVSQLVGKEVVAPGHAIFHFNAEGKCCRYDVDMDFVAAFMSIVRDPNVVDTLLGRALIMDNAIIAVAKDNSRQDERYENDRGNYNAVEYVDESEEEKPRTVYQDGSSLVSDPWRLERETTQRAPTPPEAFNQHIPAQPAITKQTRYSASSAPIKFCEKIVREIVEDYFFAFVNGYKEDAVLPSEVSQHEFLLQRFASQMHAGVTTTINCVRERWRALSECFEILSFKQKGVTQTVCDRDCNTCLVESSAAYNLRITFYTIQSVFPHLVSNMPLLDLLVDKAIVVPSQICFSVDKNTGRISRVNEQMEFAAAIAELLPDPSDLSFVVSQALLTRDGVDCGKDVSSSSQYFRGLAQSQTSRLQHRDVVQSDLRTMKIADILN
ncbi:unnamed protein product [Phytophthora lilii]|uniref:Unnamed protein product n=1 Tax=Phytophthora lilii TaxID=2077276 RepID=A0A9W6UBV6_9STRA|nr:unnamed protein product [Phytophthora lilii]